MKILLRSILFAAALGAPAAYSGDFNGVWNTDFGQVRIQERAGSFCGEYGTTGFVAGYTNGTFARGIFVHADQNTGALDNKPDNRGLFQWVQSENGRFAGNWLWGLQVKFSGSDPWNGQLTSGTRPDGAQWRRNAGFCLSYLTGVPQAAMDWMRAARDIPTADTSGSVSVPTPEPAPAPEPVGSTPVPAHVDLGGANIRNCHMSRNNRDILLCETRTTSGGAWTRYALDLSLCQSGTVARVATYDDYPRLECHAQVSGSYIRSCDPMRIFETYVGRNEEPARVDMRYETHCAGPNLNMVGSREDGKQLYHSQTRGVYYDRRGGDRRYQNVYLADACPSRSFWNENGTLRCSGN